jgi:hypothetical protein
MDGVGRNVSYGNEDEQVSFLLRILGRCGEAERNDPLIPYPHLITCPLNEARG